MLFAVDVGNTNVTLVVFDGEEIKADWRLPADPARTADEYADLILDLLNKASIPPSELTGFALCSVVPPAVDALTSFARRTLNIADPYVLTADVDLDIIINYEPKSDLGPDRIANALAAYKLYGGPVIAIDLGTATTLDAIDANGVYLGGAIAPGLEVSYDALVAKTARIPRTALTAPAKAIGSTTAECLQSGLILGCAAQVDGLVARFEEEMSGKAYVVATGGLAGLIAGSSRAIREVNPQLTLQGIRFAYERNKGTG